MEFIINPEWDNLLSEWYKTDSFKKMMSFVNMEYKIHPNSTFPEKSLIFKSLSCSSIADIKVVIIGQDPYPTKGHANGLSFSVNSDVSPLPKSLKNIFKELSSDLLKEERKNGNLNDWARQGVLLLNNVLTVHEGEAGSHFNQGWEEFTSEIIQILNKEHDELVFILWGAKAQKKCDKLSEKKHLIIKSPHPSPLSSYRGFFGSKPFSKVNSYLISKGKEPINW